MRNQIFYLIKQYFQNNLKDLKRLKNKVILFHYKTCNIIMIILGTNKSYDPLIQKIMKILISFAGRLILKELVRYLRLNFEKKYLLILLIFLYLLPTLK